MHPVDSPLLDVVTVPDFRPAAAALFEVRTLFFLASWLTRAGRRARERFTLSLACIGEPPGSVRRLAAQAGAEISVHAPLPLNDGSTANKLRGFETAGRSPRLLLVDADALFVNDLGGLIDTLPADAMAASPAGHDRVTEAEWETIYDALGLPRPVERILSIRAELGLRERREMYPYYNSGVLLLPRAVDLRPLWEQDVAAISALGMQKASDQAGLATALHRLRLAGAAFQRLPPAYHVCPPHFEGGAMPFEDVRIFHAVGFLRGLQALEEAEPGLEAYAARLPPAGVRFLRDLWRDYVRPAIASPRPISNLDRFSHIRETSGPA